MTNALLVVAHPDDDAIFGGALQIAHRWMRWQVVCATYQAADDRAQEMACWQKHVGGETPLFLGFPDNPTDLKTRESSFTPGEVSAALGALDLRPDLIVTHDPAGEYGHPHHKTVAAAMRGLLPGVPIITFAHYRPDPNFVVEVHEFAKPAMAAYASQRRVIRHFHRKLQCCRVGKYLCDSTEANLVSGTTPPARKRRAWNPFRIRGWL